MRAIKHCSVLLLSIFCISCAQKIPVCKKNMDLDFNSGSSELSFSLNYLPRNILNDVPDPNIEKIDYNEQFENYLYAKLSQIGIDKNNVQISNSRFENFKIKINKVSPYQVCDLSSLQLDLQQRLNTRYHSYFTVDKVRNNIINSDTVVVPYTPMTLRFVNLDDHDKSIGAGAVLVDYLYFNEDNDKVYQKIRGFIDTATIDVDIPYAESSEVKVDDKLTVFIRNVRLSSNAE